MRIREITVKAGRTFNHPYESYSNLRCDVETRAELAPEDDHAEATKALQARSEQLVEDHKQSMLRSLRELRELSQREQRVASLQSQIERFQSELDELRACAQTALPLQFGDPRQEVSDDDEDPDREDDESRYMKF